MAQHKVRLQCLQLSVLAYNLRNLWRRLVLPEGIDHWSLTSLQQRLVKQARYDWLLWAFSSDAAGVRCDAGAGLGDAGAGGVTQAVAVQKNRLVRREAQEGEVSEKMA